VRRTSRCTTAAGLLFFCAPLYAQFTHSFQEELGIWTIGNSHIIAEFQLAPDGFFGVRGITDPRTGVHWAPPPGVRSTPFRLQFGERTIDEHTRFRLIEHAVRPVPRRGSRQTIVLDIEDGAVRLEVEFIVYADQPVLRYRTQLRNRSGADSFVQEADILAWHFEAIRGPHRVFRVNQWVGGGHYGNFETFNDELQGEDSVLSVTSGSYGQHCSWTAVRGADGNGFFLGWEFDGRLTAAVRQFPDLNLIHVASTIHELNVPVAEGGSFTTPYAFLGVFGGTWDDAAYRTQRFVEAALAQPLPDREFPYVMWNSWKYQTGIDEETLRRNALIAARLGAEVFVVDLGWATHIGEWTADPKKFPSGMRALSDYVHLLGMKFGVHFALAEAAPASAVLRANPDWTSSVSYNYFGAVSICFAHRPVRDWIIAEAVRMIDEYNVDWILQDGENMVKHCDKASHTHDSDNSNWANAVEGINFVVQAIQAQRPRVRWENCQNGGNMMTYNMVRRYATSITADDSGELRTRQAIHGVTYPFPPRYTDRYMPSEELNSYITRSYMFGGPWILMNRLAQMRETDLQFLASEIGLYKALRTTIRDGKVQHYSPRPNGVIVDAIGSYNEEKDTAIVFVYAPDTRLSSYLLRPRDLRPEGSYRVRFQENPATAVRSGQDLMQRGIRVDIPHNWFGEIVFIEPAPAVN
jgi:alpha-galactosidase